MKINAEIDESKTFIFLHKYLTNQKPLHFEYFLFKNIQF